MLKKPLGMRLVTKKINMTPEQEAILKDLEARVKVATIKNAVLKQMMMDEENRRDAA